MTLSQPQDLLIKVHKGALQNHEPSSESGAGPFLKLAPRVAIAHRHYSCLPPSEQLRLRALAAAQSGYSAVLISKSAARMHGLWVIPRPQEEVELALPGANLPCRSRRRPGWTYHKTALRDVVEVQGARCVSPARAVVDIARFHGFIDGVVAADSALVRGVSGADLAAELEILGRVRNSRIVRDVISAAAPQARCALQSRCRALLLERGIPCSINCGSQQRRYAGPHAMLCLNDFLFIDIVRGDCRPSERFSVERRGGRYVALVLRPRDLIDRPGWVIKAVESLLERRRSFLAAQGRS